VRYHTKRKRLPQLQRGARAFVIAQTFFTSGMKISRVSGSSGPVRRKGERTPVSARSTKGAGERGSKAIRAATESGRELLKMAGIHTTTAPLWIMAEDAIMDRSQVLSSDRLRFVLGHIKELLWVKPLVLCVLSIGGIFIARLADDMGLSSVLPEINLDSVESLLSIMASSMLVIATLR